MVFSYDCRYELTHLYEKKGTVADERIGRGRFGWQTASVGLAELSRHGRVQHPQKNKTLTRFNL